MTVTARLEDRPALLIAVALVSALLMGKGRIVTMAKI
jgi:hypothetical protein